MKKVTRTIETHKITPAIVAMKNGKLETTQLDPIVVSNVTMNEQKALKLIQKTYGKTKQYVITRIETTKTTYAMDVEKFMELASPINGESEEETEN